MLRNPKIYDIIWHQSFKKRYHLNLQTASAQRLRLVLGLGRSGTTWVANTLARTQTPIRYFEEPLYHITPKLYLSRKSDHTAIPFQEKLGDRHRLRTAYLSFTCTQKLPEGFLADKFYKRKGSNFDAVLVKEVHGLLCTEALLKALSCPTLLVLRDPIRILDSLLNAQTINTHYLTNEYQYVKQAVFLNNYLSLESKVCRDLFEEIEKEKHKRLRIIGQKYGTIILIQKMFEKIAERNSKAMVISYEDLVSSSNEHFARISNFFSINYQADSYNFSHKDNKASLQNPYSISRNTSEQTEKPLIFLQPNDLNFIKRLSKLLPLRIGTIEKY